MVILDSPNTTSSNLVQNIIITDSSDVIVKTAFQTVVDYFINVTNIEEQLDALIVEDIDFEFYFNLTRADAEVMFRRFRPITPNDVQAS